MTKVYRSDICRSMHESMSGLHRIGLVDDATMRRFDESCLVPLIPMTPEEIKELREREDVSQESLALHLGVTTELVDQWERGEAKPTDPSLKLLTLVKAKGLDAVL